MVQLFDESATWRLKSWRFDKEGKVRLTGKRRVAAVSNIFDSIAENTSFYLAYGLERRARLLTDLPGEVLLLEDMGGDEEFLSDSSAMHALGHALPMLGNISLDTLLRIRHEDRESFAAYRHEISAITAEALEKGLSEASAREFMRARIVPNLNRIKLELEAEGSKTTKYLGWGATALAASVGIGLCGLPLLTTIPLAATAAAVGTRLLGKGSESAIEGRVEVKKRNDLYFLARLLEDG